MLFAFDLIEHIRRRLASTPDRASIDRRAAAADDLRELADLWVSGGIQVRVGYQSQDCKGARPHHTVCSARPRRRGDRIEMRIAAAHESACGTKRTCRGGPTTSAVEGRTDMPFK